MSAKRVLALRGAVQIDADNPGEVHSAARDVVSALLSRNALNAQDLVSLFFTVTPDITSAFPAAGVRELGIVDVPMLCATEIDVCGALPRVVRVMAHAYSTADRCQVRHTYLRGAEVLRPDLCSGLATVPRPHAIEGAD